MPTFLGHFPKLKSNKMISLVFRHCWSRKYSFHWRFHAESFVISYPCKLDVTLRTTTIVRNVIKIYVYIVYTYKRPAKPGGICIQIFLLSVENLNWWWTNEAIKMTFLAVPPSFQQQIAQVLQERPRGLSKSLCIIPPIRGLVILSLWIGWWCGWCGKMVCWGFGKFTLMNMSPMHSMTLGSDDKETSDGRTPRASVTGCRLPEAAFRLLRPLH